MLDRRTFLGAVTGSLVAAVGTANAQQSGRVARVGVLSPAIGRNPIEEVFEDALGTLGWLKGRNLVIEERYAGGRQDTIAPLAAELIGRALDVLVVWGPHCAIAAKAGTTQIPVVFLVVGDPIEAGLVTTMAKPGGNLTGVTEYATLEVHAKRLQLLKEAVRGLNRVAILRSREDTQSSGAKQAIAAAVDGLGLTMVDAVVDTPATIEPVMRTAKAQGAQALYFFPSGFAYSYAQQIADAALAHKLPSVHPFREGAVAGTMLSYATTLVLIARRGAAYVDKILKGAKPGDMPVEQTADYEFVINLKTAKALGLTIPPSLLQRADQVIE